MSKTKGHTTNRKSTFNLLQASILVAIVFFILVNISLRITTPVRPSSSYNIVASSSYGKDTSMQTLMDQAQVPFMISVFINFSLLPFFCKPSTHSFSLPLTLLHENLKINVSSLIELQSIGYKIKSSQLLSQASSSSASAGYIAFSFPIYLPLAISLSLSPSLHNSLSLSLSHCLRHPSTQPHTQLHARIQYND